MTELRRVALLGGNRTPFARAGGPYLRASNQDLLTAALDGLVTRFGLAGEQLGEVAAGAVMKHSRDFNLTRESVLGTALDPRTPACDLQQACATSVQAANYLANKIKVGQLDSGVAGGADSSSDAPVAASDGLRRILLDLNRARTPGDRARVLARFRPGFLSPEIPQAAEPRTGLSMGEHMALTTAAWAITRAEQDELAAASHHNLAAAWDSGFFTDLVTPYLGVTADTNLRRDTSLEKLAALKPVFGRSLDAAATMTAGNSTPLTDGAATVLLSSEEWAHAHGLTPQAWFVDAETAAVDFVTGNEGMLMAPAYATARLLARHGLALQDFDFYEIHEAFAATPLTLFKAWESEEFCVDRLGLNEPLGAVDRSRLNVRGGSVAAGHPFAATGARILATAAKLLAEHGGRALITVCAAGGIGVSAILEAAG